MKLVYNAILKNGKLHIYRRSEFLKEVLIFGESKLEIIVQKKKRKRSTLQNAYYWGIVVKLVKNGLLDVGYKVGMEETHELLKSKFLKKELVNESTGEILHSINSTTKLTTTEMMGYFAEITQWASEYLNIQIPEPGEQLNIEL